MPEPTSCPSGLRLSQSLSRFFFFTLIWLILTSFDLTSWPFGVPTVLLATWLSSALTGAQTYRLNAFRLARYLPFFLTKSLISGIDVMVRVLHPRLPIDPGLIEFFLNIPHEQGRIFLANSITLLPGTISARLSGDRLIIHTLDRGLPVVAKIQEMERRIAALYDPCSGKETGRELP